MLAPGNAKSTGPPARLLLSSLKEVFVDDTQTVHVLRSRTACLGTTLSIPQLTYRQLNGHAQITCIPMEEAPLLSLAITACRRFPTPSFVQGSISFVQTFCTSDLIVACSHKPRLQAHSSALASSVRVIKFSTNLPRGTENFGLDLLSLSRPTLIGVRESLVESRTFHERCLGRVILLYDSCS
jgi:hypothetical protein